MLTMAVLLLMAVSVMGIVNRIQAKAKARENAEYELRRRAREVKRRKALREQGKDPDEGRPKSRRIRKKRKR